MKKITGIIILIFIVLVVAAYSVYNNIFPKAKPIKQIDSNMITEIKISNNNNEEINIESIELKELLKYLGQGQSTRRITVNDYPSVRPYYLMEFKTDEGSFRYVIYEENGTTYLELPYEGIYKIDNRALKFFK